MCKGVGLGRKAQSGYEESTSLMNSGDCELVGVEMRDRAILLE